MQRSGSCLIWSNFRIFSRRNWRTAHTTSVKRAGLGYGIWTRTCRARSRNATCYKVKLFSSASKVFATRTVAPADILLKDLDTFLFRYTAYIMNMVFVFLEGKSAGTSYWAFVFNKYGYPIFLHLRIFYMFTCCGSTCIWRSASLF
jgi:hypothetical protein